MYNLVDFTFGPATADWTKVFALGIVGPSNNVLVWQAISSAPFKVLSGHTLVLRANEVILSLS